MMYSICAAAGKGTRNRRLSIEQTNANNHYKDSLRTRELGIRKKYTEELKNRNEIKRFIDSQLACWPLAHHNHEALQTVQTKELSINGYTFVVQCNAQRAVSTTAKVDKDSIQARPCFPVPRKTSLRSRKHWKPSLQQNMR